MNKKRFHGLKKTTFVFLLMRTKKRIARSFILMITAYLALSNVSTSKKFNASYLPYHK
jgi:hypothetical protein